MQVNFRLQFFYYCYGIKKRTAIILWSIMHHAWETRLFGGIKFSKANKLIRINWMAINNNADWRPMCIWCFVIQMCHFQPVDIFQMKNQCDSINKLSLFFHFLNINNNWGIYFHFEKVSFFNRSLFIFLWDSKLKNIY